ncbi:phenylalanine--tRNA ligase subunit alpha [candidate division KSB1 bacterium]
MVNKVQYNEYHIINTIAESKDHKIALEAVVEKTGIHQTYVTATSDKLEEEGLIKIEKTPIVIFRLGRDGETLFQDGMPERIALEYAVKKNTVLDLPEIPRLLKIEQKGIGDIIKWGSIKGWFKKEGKSLIVTDKGKNDVQMEGEDEKLINILGEKGKLNKDEIGSLVNIEEALKLLKGRGTSVKYREKELKVLKLTDAGKKYVDEGLEIVEEVNRITQEMLMDGSWRNFAFRKYKVDDILEKEFPGKMHPLQKVIEETRKAFLEMGFEETFSPYVESAFWDFDALFQPQDHPAREMQDTFYMKNPAKTVLPKNEFVNRVKDTHENGGDTGSTGWGYKWSIDKAMQAILRTHNTANSIRYIAGHPIPPYKVFEIGPVFRREKIDQKHLPEFHQVDGIIVDESASLSSLLGTLAEFYRKMGFEKVKFKPDFFPYTEPSVSVTAKMENTGAVIELGGAGVFRPEVTEPFGCKTPVLAWGLGLERLAMVRYNISDIRKFYMNDIQWLREVPLVL